MRVTPAAWHQDPVVAARPVRARRRRLRRMVLGATVAIGVLAGGLPASAVDYSGNLCGSMRWYTQVTGGAACLYRVGGSTTYLTVQPRALDAVADGLSIRNNTRIDQFNASGALVGRNYMAVTNSAGAGTTSVGGSGQVNRVAGATRLTIVVTATRFNAPNGLVYNIETSAWSYPW